MRVIARCEMSCVSGIDVQYETVRLGDGSRTPEGAEKTGFNSDGP